MIARSIILVVLFACCALGVARPLTIEHITTEQGLSQSMVYSIFQDRKGFLWFGTRDGLNRYDGYRFMVFRHEPLDSTSLPGTVVGAITEDLDENIWVMPGKGIARLDRRTFKFTRFLNNPSNPRSLSDNAVLCMMGDRTGAIWVGTEHGLNRFDPRTGTFKRFFSDQHNAATLANDQIISIYEDRAGTIWVGTYNGYLHRYNRSQENFTRFDAGISNQCGLLCLGEDERGDIYCGTRAGDPGNAVTCVDTHNGHILKRIVLPVARNCMVQPMCIDSLGGLWIRMQWWMSPKSGNREWELRRIPLAGNTGSYDRDIQTTGGSIWTMLCDRFGIVWMGTEDGIAKIILDRPKFITYANIPGDPRSLSDDRIRSIYMDHFGSLWVGTNISINRFDERRGQWVRYVKNLLVSDAYNVMYEDADGTLLCGTNSGIVRYDRATDSFISNDFLVNNRKHEVIYLRVWSLCRDRSGMLWVGTLQEGIFLFDRHNKLVRRFQSQADNPATVGGRLVWDIHQDRTGVIWVATNTGLYRWIPERNVFKLYGVYPDDPNGLGNENVCAIMEDSTGGLWFTTYGGGVSRYNRSTDNFTRITTRDGLPSNTLYGTLMDNSGKLWMSSNTGLISYDPATHRTRVYNDRDGLQSNEFSFKAFYKSNNGELLFGGIHGVNRFFPDSLHESGRPPPLEVTEFRVFDAIIRRELSQHDTVSVNYDQSFISFEFAALDYTNAVKIRYAYRLAGFDDNWIYCGDRRYASFTNLDPGTYTFIVKSTNSDGVWNAGPPLSIMLQVVPPFWMTWWFRASAVLVALGLTVGGTLLWIRLLRGKEVLRRRSIESQLQTLRLQINPHFIFNALSSIQHLVLIRDGERAVEYLARFARLVRAVLENSDRTYIPIGEELENLEHYLHLESFRFEGRFRYSIDVAPDIDVDDISIPTMLIQPYVENAIRHGLLHKAGEGSLSIMIVRRGQVIRCVIEDDGVGRMRAAELNGTPVHKRRPMGIRVTGERLTILNASLLKGDAISMEVTDLADVAGVSRGTRVEISIPIEFP